MLSKSQRFARVKEARNTLIRLGVPPHALLSSIRLPAPSLLHLSTSARRLMRTVPGLHMVGEKAVIKWKRRMAESHGTGTASFSRDGLVGCYATDPLRFITAVASSSPFLCIGGDAGGGTCKLGVSFLNNRGQEEFAALLVYKGKDDWDSLTQLVSPDLTPFFGDTAAARMFNLPMLPLVGIFGVFQYLINTYADRCFLNRDMAFINSVIGLKSASSHFPCPICVVNKNDLLPAAPRAPPLRNHLVQVIGSYSRKRSPLIVIDSKRIVPLPLHIFLGTSNKLIEEVLTPSLGAAV